MDGTRFDTLARELVTRVTRRRVIAGILGLSASAFVGADGAEATRTCRLLGHKCVKGSQCCSGFCDQRRTTPRSRRNRCSCEVVGTEENCLACGDTCAAGESCCGGIGCVELGSLDNCQACGDVCPEGGIGPRAMMCNGANGCQAVCDAVPNGWVTTDDPPVVYPASAGDVYSYAHYVNPLAPNYDVYKTCVTSADCPDCPTEVADSVGGPRYAIGACGCMKYWCDDDGTASYHFYNEFSRVPDDTYVCMVVYTED